MAPGLGGACGLGWLQGTLGKAAGDSGMGHPRLRDICVNMNTGVVLNGRGSS